MEKIKLAVIGDRESITAFRAVGVKTISAIKKEDIEYSIESLAKSGCIVIFITEKAAAEAKEHINRYKTKTYPIILPIPDKNGSMKTGFTNIKSNVEKAIGANIFEEELRKA
jgi:V/A-type H+-transporting ATPase subunit F